MIQTYMIYISGKTNLQSFTNIFNGPIITKAQQPCENAWVLDTQVEAIWIWSAGQFGSWKATWPPSAGQGQDDKCKARDGQLDGSHTIKTS